MTRPCSATLELRLRMASELGWRSTCLDADTDWLWRIERGDRSLILAGPTSALNDAAAARLAVDKFFAGVVLRAAGLRTPETIRFAVEPDSDRARLRLRALRHPRFARARGPARRIRCLRSDASTADGSDPFASQRGLEPALAFADARGYPLIVKPNRGAQGRCVSRVDDRPALLQAVERAWAIDAIALVQPALPGLDLRVDLLDGELLLAYVRRPLRLLGDGRSTVLQLLAAVDRRASNEQFLLKLRAEALWEETLAAAGVDEHSVLDSGREIVFPATVLNLNRCCTVELFETLPDAWLALCRRIATALRLRHCGIDLRVPASSDPLATDPAEATVLEVNTSPSITTIHQLGAAALAESAERRVLEAMIKCMD